MIKGIDSRFRTSQPNPEVQTVSRPYSTDRNVEKATRLAANVQSADRSDDALACADRSLNEVMPCGLPESAFGPEFQAAISATQNLREAHSGALAS